jgi:hypothetical protein
MEFVKELPTNGFGRSTKYAEEAAELQAHPGEWALFKENASSSMASLISNGALVAFRPAGAYEAATRNVKLGYGQIYVRYVGVE